ncbi:hypothetical protein HN858_05535 [Candidatus Falkowbacteria bacterium]|jgi:hypothetical protein|nr:hypothetical protein [Candidatus Falkowbacteria bacterium]MBT5502914.1 hypothetical protein [Candidatus Falkowbacteria bacterium]MBT6573722.1 hypothetical protein [Candidatus Falkowbacteria bacterium]MBT7349098.1 hypothetical protein [Candidatus Falkowbacteria bacterium]MBT7500049.1 hypothetical protein [Candidatus Falkowbacteria bacterium]
MEYLIGEFNIHPDSNPQQPIFDENENVLGVVDFEGCTDPNQAAVLFGLGKLDFSEVKAVWFRGQFESYWYKEDDLGEVLRKLSNGEIVKGFRLRQVEKLEDAGQLN